MAAAGAAGIKGHLFQGSDIVGFFSEQGLWPKHSYVDGPPWQALF
jgi:hypothetical protein